MKKLQFIIYLFLFLFFFSYSRSNVFAATTTTLYLPSYDRTVETGERNTYYAVPGMTMQRVLKDGVEKIYNLFPDHLGSTRVMAANNHSTISYLSYYPYGNTKTFTNPNSALQNRYTGQEQDSEVDLYYYNARYYNPQIAHFISADKVEGPNRYAYVGNNPIMKNDPSGNMNQIDDGGGGLGMSPINYMPGIGASGVLGLNTGGYGQGSAGPSYGPAGYMGREEQIAWVGAFGAMVVGTGIVAGGIEVGAALIPVLSGVSQASPDKISATLQKITSPANSLIDRLARLPISLRDKINIFDNGAINMKTGQYVEQIVERSYKADVLQNASSFKGPLETAQNIMANVVRNGTAGKISAMMPHNAWENAYKGVANCLDCSLMAQDYLAGQGIESVVANLSRTSSHYGLWIPSEQSLVTYGGRIITGGAARAARVIDRLVNMGGGARMFQ